MFNKLIDILIANKKFVFTAAIAVVIFGMYSYYVIPKQENPDTRIAAVTITTVYPGASPSQVEREVTDVIESAISELLYIDYYESVSINSASIITIVYDMEYTIDDVETILRRTIDEVAADLPDIAVEPAVNTEIVSDNQFIISLSGENYTDTELASYALDIKNDVLNISGVERVDIEGLRPQRVVVEIDTAAISQFGISIETVYGFMQASSVVIPSGEVLYQGEEINVLTSEAFVNVLDIENLVLAATPTGVITIGDIADVYIEEVGEYFYSQDGKPAILLTGRFYEGENAVNIGRELREVINEAEESLPGDITFHEILYAPSDISESIDSFVLNLLQSILLIVAVVMIGVHLRNGIVVSVALPLSILSTFIVMYLIGEQFHFISIAALIISLGILVDNAIVISEAVQFHLNKGEDNITAAKMALRETAVPIFTSTLTTIVTFSIIYFVPGVVGKVAGSIPTVVITALIASYIVAICITPLLTIMFFVPEKKERAIKESILKRIFKKLLSVSLRFKAGAIIAMFLSLAIAALLVLQLGMQFFPSADKPTIYIDFYADEISLESAEEISLEMNKIIEETDGVDNYSYGIGKGLPSFFLTAVPTPELENAGQYMLQLDSDRIDELGGIDAITNGIESRLEQEIEGASFEVRQLEYSLPSDADIAFEISGDNYEELLALADSLKAELSTIDGTQRVRDDRVEARVQSYIEIDDTAVSLNGLTRYDLLKQLNTTIMGAKVGEIYIDAENTDIIVKGDIESYNNLQNLYITNSAGVAIPLSELATIETEDAILQINHYNGEDTISVLADVLDGYNALYIENDLWSYIDTLDTEGIKIESKGEVSNMLGLISSLGIAALFAVIVIYLILLIQFKSMKKPLIILVSIPLSFIGSGFGLWIFDMDIQAMALLGLVTLFGIVVNNSILLIEVMDAQIRAGSSLVDACQAAVDKRFRPIMLSSITTCIGLVPLIISGDSMTAPMASVLLFGLLFSTFLTLVIVPTLYAIQSKKGTRKRVKR